MNAVPRLMPRRLENGANDPYVPGGRLAFGEKRSEAAATALSRTKRARVLNRPCPKSRGHPAGFRQAGLLALGLVCPAFPVGSSASGVMRMTTFPVAGRLSAHYSGASAAGLTAFPFHPTLRAGHLSCGQSTTAAGGVNRENRRGVRFAAQVLGAASVAILIFGAGFYSHRTSTWSDATSPFPQ